MVYRPRGGWQYAYMHHGFGYQNNHRIKDFYYYDCALPELDPCQTVVVQLAMVCVPMGACMGSIGKP